MEPFAISKAICIMGYWKPESKSFASINHASDSPTVNHALTGVLTVRGGILYKLLQQSSYVP